MKEGPTGDIDDQEVQCTSQSTAYVNIASTGTDHTYVKCIINVDSSQESSDKSLELLSENEELKVKISSPESENMKYKKEID